VDRLGARRHPGGGVGGSVGRAVHRRCLAHLDRQRGAPRLHDGRPGGPCGPLAPAAGIVLLDAAEGRASWRELRGPAELLPERRNVDPAALIYTSGTTGPPKGVPLTHGNLTFQINALTGIGLVTPGDRVCLPLPLHHVYPFVVGLLTPLALGLPLVLPHALTGPQIVRALKDGEATVCWGAASVQCLCLRPSRSS
jgi:acyl-CoA synthetase (AMP-forming)/AMP-acid ligase II